MFEINRGVIIVKRKQVFVDWINTHGELEKGETITLVDANSEPGIYMIPPYDEDEEFKEILPDAIERIWQAELSGWNTDENSWPKDLSVKKFHSWFSYEAAGIAFDLLDDELERQEV